MRRISFVGLMLGAACAMCLTASASALASGPSWYECAKVKGGAYEKGCAKEGGKGGYVARAGLGSGGGSLSAKGTGSTVLQAVDGHTITCGNFAVEGEREMPDLLKDVTLTFKSCFKTGTKNKCYGQEEEEKTKSTEIVSETLDGELGYISHSPLAVGVRLYNAAEPGGVIVQRIYCGAGGNFWVRLRGYMTGELRGAVNVSATKATVAYVLGAYLGEVSPGYTPLTDPPLEGEAAGALVMESKAAPGEGWGEPLPAGVSGTLKVSGTLMVRA